MRRRAVVGCAALVVAAVTACGTNAPAPAASASRSVASQPAPTESLLTSAPDAHSSVGTLADGFPAQLIPVPDGAEVLVSAAKQIGTSDLWDVSLNLRTPQDSAGLVDVYRQRLVAAGFTETAPSQVEPGLSAQTTFTRADGSEILVIGVLDRDGGRTLTLGGHVRTSP